jgi:hypothetical protein
VLMRLIDRLSRSQRIVVVVAIGLGLWVVGSYLVNLGSGFHVGWTGNAQHVFSTAPLARSTGLPPLARVIIWLVLICVWALAAIKVLRQPGDSQTASEPNHEPAE